MPEYILHYDIASILVLMVFVAYYYTRRRFPSLINKIYSNMVVGALIACVLDIAAVVTIMYKDVVPVWLNYFTNCGYLIVNNFNGYLLAAYILLHGQKTQKSLTRKMWTIIYIPAALVILAIITTPITKLIIFFDEDRNYHYGPAFSAIYAVALLYLITSFLHMIFANEDVALKKRVSVFLFEFFLIGAVIFQFFNPEFLVTGIATTLGALAIYLSQQNTNDVMDQVTDLFNRRALSIRISENLMKSKPFYIIAVKPDNFASLYNKFGYSYGDSLLRDIAGFLSGMSLQDATYKLDNELFAVMGEDNIVPAEDIIRKIIGRFKKPWKDKDGTIRLSASMYCIKCPEDSGRTDEIMDMIESAIVYAAEMGNGKVLYSDEYVTSRERMIDQMERKQRQLEEITREAEEAKEEAIRADQSKSTFLANMSHEIRTPLTTILGMTEVALRNELPDSICFNLQSIQNAGNSLLTIINDILDFSKIEAGKMEIVPAPYQIASTFDSAFNTASVKLKSKNIRFVADIDPTIPSMLIGDETRFRQIILNLLSNAIKYTENGVITMKADWKKKGDLALLSISVTDTGKGIRKEDQEKLFRRFIRFESDSSKAIEGTGLGLAICKRILGLMGSEIKVASEYGIGSTFSFQLLQGIEDERPLAVVDDVKDIHVLLYLDAAPTVASFVKSFAQLGIKADYASSFHQFRLLEQDGDYTHLILEEENYRGWLEEESGAGLGRKIILLQEERQYYRSGLNVVRVVEPICCMSIAAAFQDTRANRLENETKKSWNYIAPSAKLLVVDDNSVNLQIVKELLAPHRMQVDLVGSGQECIQKVKKKKYHIIFLDHMMPEMDGIETLRIMRTLDDNPNADTPVVAFTANAVSGMKEQFFKEGFNDYLTKPINIVKMEDIITNFLPKDIVIQTEEELQPEKKLSYFPDSIPGVDIQKGLDHCANDKSKYLRLLRTVYLDGMTKRRTLEEQLSTRNLKNYIIDVHALKSVAASIGALELSEIASQIENYGKSDRYTLIPEKHRHMMNNYNMLLRALEECFEEARKHEDNGEAESSCERDQTETLTCILALLHDYEQDLAMKLLIELKSSTDDANLRQVLGKIQDRFELYDFEDAEKLIEERLREVEKDDDDNAVEYGNDGYDTAAGRF